VTGWLARTSREAIRLAQPLVPREERGVAILAYHLVGAGTQSPVDLPADVFRAQLEELRDIADVCSLDDAVAHLAAGTPGSRVRVALTFDDGFDNFRTTAWPILKRLEMPCTVYVPVGFVEGTAPVPLAGVGGLRPMAWGDLRTLAGDPLLTVGSHSWCHRDLRALSGDNLRRDLRHSRLRLEDRTGLPVEHFCYPQAKWSDATETVVRSVYRTAVVAGGRRNLTHTFNPHRLWRVPVRRDMPIRLGPIVQSALCLEEWAASRARAFL
jgi:peptidoglycan/xylan/chitin deacetylase (PgdA/CDA1 family)